MILRIPVRRKNIRIDGADTSVLELANGFVNVVTDNQGTLGEPIQISNPLTEVFQDLFNRGFVGVDERVQIILEELPFSKPGENDDPISLNHLDQIV